MPVPYPSWLNTGDNTWQVVAATFVGLMSLPALAVLYASIVPKKMAVNVLAMMFAGFSLVLVAWVLWTYKMGFGATSLGHGVSNGCQTWVGGGTQCASNLKLSTGNWLQHFFDNFVGRPGQVTNAFNEQGQAVSAANTTIPFHFPTDSLVLFQFVFGAITPLLFIGSVLGRIKFSAWCLLIVLWSTFVYGIDAFLLWGGGYFAQEGALDFSGGFVIHMSAGVSGFVAAWVLGPRLAKDRQHFLPNNLVMAAVGAGILWLGWNGFNGGDPYYAGADMSAAVVNTDLCTAVGVVTWMAMDAWLSKAKKPTFLGGVNGMICGLVGITPCAGWVNGWGAILVGVIDTVIVWVCWNYLSKVRPFSKVDDALGVVYTHGIAGFFGGLMLGVFGDPNMLEYGCGHLTASGQVVSTSAGLYASSSKTCSPSSVSGLMYTGSFHQLWEQFRAALFVIFWSALVTFVIMQICRIVLRGLRYKDEVIEIGDTAMHDEEAFPEAPLAERVGGGGPGAFELAGLGKSGNPPTVRLDIGGPGNPIP
ncbi:MAG TPA: ammonium transporter [Acidimicrobiales bacterium]|nr:ammonium transporter [Acidimicrobiales bacterium]